MTEKQLEQKLVNEVKDRGGIAYKFTSPGHVGVPDRIVILPGGKVGFVEVKKPNEGKLSTIQLNTLHKLSILGCRVYVLDSLEVLKDILDDLDDLELHDTGVGWWPQFLTWCDIHDPWENEI